MMLLHIIQPMKRSNIKFLLVIILGIVSTNVFSQTLNTPNVDSRLYLGASNSQPLIVGLGGSEGGNAWDSNRWKETRDKFIEKGYAFLAIGYFGMKGTPEKLDRISIDNIHDAIIEATKNPKVNKRKVAIIGGSRGADLALLLASHYKDIKCVVGIVPSHVAFPANANDFSTSAWTFKGKQIPFVPVSEEAVPSIMKGDLRTTFEIMLKDEKAEKKAIIKVEKINGPIFLISATKDEIAPTTEMSEKMINRLKKKKFKFHFEHLPIEGSHAEPQKHFDKVLAFLESYFLV
jgi:uncharacterized protein